MLRAMNHKQFLGWECYARLEPFAEWRMDYRMGHIVQALLNVNLGKDQKAYELKDIVLKFDDQEPKPKMTIQQQIFIAKFMANQAAFLHKQNKGRG